MKQWSTLSVSVANLDEVLKLWCGAFGLEEVARREGTDPELARLWDLHPDEFKCQALLANPGEETGKLHFVEFDSPGPAFRENSTAFDRCPKNIDIYAQDMPARIEDLKTAGYSFQRDDYSEMTAPDGTRFREIHMVGHDAINIVLIEIIGMPLPFTDKGFSGLGPVVTVVDDATQERDFYQQLIGLDLLNDNLLEGPTVEQAFGLPPGGGMDITIWGSADNGLGRMQVVDYRGTEGNNLYPNAIPMQRGILQVTYESTDLPGLIRQLDEAGVAWTQAGDLDLIYGSGQFIRLHSPAGFQIDVFAP